MQLLEAGAVPKVFRSQNTAARELEQKGTTITMVTFGGSCVPPGASQLLTVTMRVFHAVEKTSAPSSPP